MKIIAIGAHLDDVELACGGTIVKAIKNGHEVRVVVLSDSSYKHYSGKFERKASEAISEGRKAAKVLMIEEHNLKIYNFPAKDIENNSEVVEVLNAEFDTFQPDLIFTHWQFDTHKSHMNTALATFAAARYFNSILMFEPFPPAGRSYMTFRPQFYVNITETIDIKLEAISIHESELKKYGIDWINTIRARAALRGFELISNSLKQQQYAEAFEVLRMNIDII